MWAASDTGTDNNGNDNDKNNEVSRGKLQLTESRGIIEKLKSLGSDGITEVRMVTDASENERRAIQEERVKKRNKVR